MTCGLHPCRVSTPGPAPRPRSRRRLAEGPDCREHGGRGGDRTVARHVAERRAGNRRRPPGRPAARSAEVTATDPQNEAPVEATDPQNEAPAEATGAALRPIVAPAPFGRRSSGSRADAPRRRGAGDRGGTLPAAAANERDAAAGALRCSAENARAVPPGRGLTTASVFILHG